jgi:hypothetical protein
MPLVSRVDLSYPRDAIPYKHYRNGTPNDLGIT